MASGTQIAIGDLVMVHNEKQPRGFWKMAKVENLIIGKEGSEDQRSYPESVIWEWQINCATMTHSLVVSS